MEIELTAPCSRKTIRLWFHIHKGNTKGIKCETKLTASVLQERDYNCKLKVKNKTIKQTPFYSEV